MIGEELNIIDTTGVKCPDGKMLVQSMEGKSKLNLVLPQSHEQLSWVITVSLNLSMVTPLIYVIFFT